MTSRDEVRIDIEVEGGAKAERQFNRAEKGARGLGRSTRGLINPLLGAGLVAGILGGGLLGLALSSGAASNSIFRIQGALEGLVGGFFRNVEPGIDRAAAQFEKLPIGAQLAVAGAGVILSIGLVAAISAAGGAVATAVTALVATHITAPLVAGVGSALTASTAAITSIIGPLVAGISAAVALAVTAVVVGLAALAFIAWDLIFNDGALLERFETWLSGIGWVNAIDTWDKEVLTPSFTRAWQNALDIFDEFFAGPIIAAWEVVRDLFKDDFTTFFTETIPDIFKGAWDDAIAIFRQHFIGPLFTAWYATRDFFEADFTKFFTETIPEFFEDGWDDAIAIFRENFIGPFFIAWYATRDLFEDDFTNFFTKVIPDIFEGAWKSVYDLFVIFANTLIGGMNALITSIGKLPIPVITIGVAYTDIGGFKLPYPTFRVSTRPLSSFSSAFSTRIPTIATRDQEDRTQSSIDRDFGQQRGGGTTNNYYSLAANDFDRRVNGIVNAPNSQAVAAGLP